MVSFVWETSILEFAVAIAPKKNRKGNCKYKNGFFPCWKESILEFAVAIAPTRNRKGNCKYKNGFFPFWKESILEFACFFMSPQSDGN